MALWGSLCGGLFRGRLLRRCSALRRQGHLAPKPSRRFSQHGADLFEAIVDDDDVPLPLRPHDKADPVARSGAEDFAGVCFSILDVDNRDGPSNRLFDVVVVEKSTAARQRGALAKASGKLSAGSFSMAATTRARRLVRALRSSRKSLRGFFRSPLHQELLCVTSSLFPPFVPP